MKKSESVTSRGSRSTAGDPSTTQQDTTYTRVPRFTEPRKTGLCHGSYRFPILKGTRKPQDNPCERGKTNYNQKQRSRPYHQRVIKSDRQHVEPRMPQQCVFSFIFHSSSLVLYPLENLATSTRWNPRVKKKKIFKCESAKLGSLRLPLPAKPP